MKTTASLLGVVVFVLCAPCGCLSGMSEAPLQPGAPADQPPPVPSGPEAADANQAPAQGNDLPGAPQGGNTPLAPYVGANGQQTFANGYTCTTAVEGSGDKADVVLRIANHGVPVTRYTLGAGGAITAIRDASGTNALGPAICPEPDNEVDRISQWTCWDMAGDANSLFQGQGCGGGDCRYNVTQAGRGTCENQYTREVRIDAASCQVDIYSYHPLQWNSANQAYFGDVGITALTRVSVPVGDGSIHVQRSVLLPPTTAGGRTQDFAQFYMEQWNAFPQARFAFAAYSYEPATGVPNWFYQSGPAGNMPSYAGQLASATPGYLSVLASARAGAPTVALAFSRQNPCAADAQGGCAPIAGAVTWANLLDATGSGVVALLPSVHFTAYPVAGAIVEQHMDIMAWASAPNHVHAFLADKAAAMPQPRVIGPGITPAEGAQDVAKLRANARLGTSGAAQVAHLGGLAQ